MKIIGHRGAAALAPENTLASFRTALDAGVRTVELDVRLTADDFPVCYHDERLDRLTPESGPLSDWDWERLSQVPVRPERFGGQQEGRIPLLADVVGGLPEDTEFLVELKPAPGREALTVRRTLEVLAVAGLPERCRLFSFDPELTREARRQARELGIQSATAREGASGSATARDQGGTGRDQGFRWGALVEMRDVDRVLEQGRELEAESLHIPARAVDPALLAAAHAAGFLVNAWTVNHAEEVRRLARLGVDELTTDDPPLALAALREQG